MRTLGDCVRTVQALLGDPKGTWVKRTYILPLLDLKYGDVNLYMKTGSRKNLEAVVPLLNIPAGTTSLFPFQTMDAADQDQKGQLAGICDVIEVFAKPAGAPVSQYRPVRERNTLPHMDPQSTGPVPYGAQMFYAFIGNKLLVTPVNVAIDMEVTGKFNPTPLVDDNDLLVTHDDVWVPVCYGTAAIAGVERSNPALLESYALRESASQDNLVADLIVQQQGSPLRFQRISRESGMAQWWWSI